MSTLYEKRGRRYVPVAETEAYSGLTEGAWLVTVRPGHQSVREVVAPARAEWLAAAELARDAMLRALRKASDCRPRDGKLKGKALKAYGAWVAIMGEETMWLTRESAWDVVQAGLDAVRDEEGGTR